MSTMPPTEPTALMDAAAARRVEREKVTRRTALRKFGYGAGMSAFLLLSVDDLARMVGKRMKRMAGDNQVANQIAHEFKNSGVAFAGGPSWAGCDICTDPCVAPKYYKCTPCIGLCTGESPTAKVTCDNYTIGTDKSDCYTCCDIQWPPTSGEAMALLYLVCRNTC